MPNYIITQKAGPYVAGQRNTGVGTRLSLSERAAEHELRLGTLIEENADILAPRAQAKPLTPKSAKSASDAEAQALSRSSTGENPTAVDKPAAGDKGAFDGKPAADDKSAADAVAS